LLVSCGPSLTEHVGEIRELASNREKYFTLGINRALKAIDLDYFVAIDRRAQDDWVDRDPDRTTLIASTSAAHAVCGAGFRDRYWGEHFLNGIDEGNAPLRTGLSITLCDAMFAAYKLGAEEIWLYGCDFTLSGKEHGDSYMLEKYYFDYPSYLGLGIRPEGLREFQPVYGLNEGIGFLNYELWSYACYATAMACMIEESGGVPVRNKGRSGIFYWGSDNG
jgi:hypothetical protein